MPQVQRNVPTLTLDPNGDLENVIKSPGVIPPLSLGRLAEKMLLSKEDLIALRVNFVTGDVHQLDITPATIADDWANPANANYYTNSEFFGSQTDATKSMRFYTEKRDVSITETTVGLVGVSDVVDPVFPVITLGTLIDRLEREGVAKEALVVQAPFSGIDFQTIGSEGGVIASTLDSGDQYSLTDYVTTQYSETFSGPHANIARSPVTAAPPADGVFE